jgi:hypothetical protein
MRIAVFYPRSIMCAWSVNEALVHVLRRMGHEPLDCGLDPEIKSPDPRRYPSRDVLAACDAILISGPEHIGKFLYTFYSDWQGLKVPKVAYLHESVRREDYGTLNLDRIRAMADGIFYSAIQDEVFGLRYQPFPVDTATFNPGPAPAEGRQRLYAAVFIGTLYGKRREYYERMGLQGLVRVGNVKVIDLDGINMWDSARLLAETYRTIHVLVNRPSLSHVLVTKIGEALACGTFVLTPTLSGDAVHNMREFVDGKGVVYYDPEKADLRRTVEYYLARDDECTAIAQEGCKTIHDRHSLDRRLTQILATVGPELRPPFSKPLSSLSPESG